MKRVLAFLDTFDEIPDNSKYLFSREQKVVLEPATETTESIVQNVDIVFYEVDSMDYEDLVASGFIKTSFAERIKKFHQKYKVSK